MLQYYKWKKKKRGMEYDLTLSISNAIVIRLILQILMRHVPILVHQLSHDEHHLQHCARKHIPKNTTFHIHCCYSFLLNILRTFTVVTRTKRRYLVP